MTDQVIVADVLVNLIGAAGLATGAYSLCRTDPHGGLTRRVRYALAAGALLFALRSAAWLTGSALLERAVAAVASTIPLLALVVVEGVLRRHAPTWLKAAVAGSCATLAVVHLAGVLPYRVSAIVLMVQVVGGLLAAGALLVGRDASSLTAAENRAARRIAATTLALTCLVVTDFRSLVPDVPLRLGALGAIVLLYVSLSPDGQSTPGRHRAAALTLWALIALSLATGYVATQPVADAGSFVRVFGVALSALVLASLVSEYLAVRARRGRDVSRILSAGTSDEFQAALREHPLFPDARILKGDAVADVDDAYLRGLLGRKPVARRSEAPWGFQATDPGVERARSILDAHDASHMAMLSSQPLRLLVLCVPSTSYGPHVESEIEILAGIGRLTFSGDRA